MLVFDIKHECVCVFRLVIRKEKMSYFRESFEYQPIKMFLNSNAADIISSRGDITFNLRRDISLPSGTIGYVSLNELTVPNTNYNINTSNNKLVLLDTTLMASLNALFNPLALIDQTVTISYDDITNKYTFTHPISLF